MEIAAGRENVRVGDPYDDLVFERLAREYDVWGTASSALCAVFWQAAKAANSLTLMPPEITPDLMGIIVDEVFDSAIEDIEVIEDIYRLIAACYSPVKADQRALLKNPRKHRSQICGLKRAFGHLNNKFQKSFCVDCITDEGTYVQFNRTRAARPRPFDKKKKTRTPFVFHPQFVTDNNFSFRNILHFLFPSLWSRTVHDGRKEMSTKCISRTLRARHVTASRKSLNPQRYCIANAWHFKNAMTHKSANLNRPNLVLANSTSEHLFTEYAVLDRNAESPCPTVFKTPRARQRITGCRFNKRAHVSIYLSRFNHLICDAHHIIHNLVIEHDISLNKLYLFLSYTRKVANNDEGRHMLRLGDAVAETLCPDAIAPPQAKTRVGRRRIATELWCLHLRGPDDFIAAPTLLQAENVADEFNRLYAQKAQGPRSELEIGVEFWPHGTESHAHSLARDWPKYARLARAGRRRRLGGCESNDGDGKQ